MNKKREFLKTVRAFRVNDICSYNLRNVCQSGMDVYQISDLIIKESEQYKGYDAEEFLVTVRTIIINNRKPSINIQSDIIDEAHADMFCAMKYDKSTEEPAVIIPEAKPCEWKMEIESKKLDDIRIVPTEIDLKTGDGLFE